jgi:hypothetical protein
MVAAGDRIDAVDVSTIEASTTGKPLVRLVANATQSLSNNTNTAILFAAEDIDTHGYHSTSVNTSRVTPTLAGYYRCRGTVMLGARSDYTVINAWIRKNGTSNLAGGTRSGGAFGSPAGSQVNTAYAEAIVSCDGVTDYVELVGNQANTAAVSTTTNQSSQFSSCFEVEYLRPL